jgi:hypothetical protein
VKLERTIYFIQALGLDESESDCVSHTVVATANVVTGLCQVCKVCAVGGKTLFRHFNFCQKRVSSSFCLSVRLQPVSSK